MPSDLPPGAEKSGRAAPAALPAKEHGGEVDAGERPRSTPLACDLCGNARTRDERHRLVWERDPDTRLVLAELCRGCATVADPLLELHGGRGREAIELVREIRASPPPRPTVQPRVLGFTARGLLYLLIAIASFVLVTLVTSWGLGAP